MDLSKKIVFHQYSEIQKPDVKKIKDYNLELITINDMYSIDGGVTNTNETYLTIMNDNLELLKKELTK